jgi:uncharacterized membrane protein YedE/YeeE
MKLLLMGLLTGMRFGFLLQRARVVRYDKQIGALRLQDMTIVKFMFSSVLVGMVCIYLLRDFGLVSLLYKPAILSENIIGGLVFGIGWGLLGYCPGTQGGALGEGRWDALWGIMGMLFGAGLYAEFYTLVAERLLGWGFLGFITLPQVLGVNHWFVIFPFVGGGLALFYWFEKKGL